MTGDGSVAPFENRQESERRSSGRKIFLNFAFLSTGKILGDGLLFLLFVTLARWFGTEGLGMYSFAIALTGFFAAVSDYGLFQFSVKEISRRQGPEGRELTSDILCLRVVLSAGVFLLLLAVSFFLPLSFEEKLIINLVGLYQVLYRIAEGIGAVFVAHEDMHYAGALEIFSKALIALPGIAAAVVLRDLVVTVAVLPAMTLVVLALCGRVLWRKYGGLSWWRPWSAILRTGREAVPYALSKMLAQVYLRTDVVVIGFMLGSAAAGVYNAAYRLVFFLLVIPQFASFAMLPVTSKLYERSAEKLKDLYSRALNRNIIIGLPAAAGLCLIAPQLIGMIFGEEFGESVLILRLLSWLLLLMCVKSVLSIFLISCNREVDRTRSQWTAAWMNVLGNLVLIPLLGIRGAAITTLVSDGVLVFLLAYRLGTILAWPQVGARVAIGVLGAIAFYVPFTLLPDVPLLLVIPSSVAIYVMVILLFKDIRETEGRMFLDLFGTFRSSRV